MEVKNDARHLCVWRACHGGGWVMDIGALGFAHGGGLFALWDGDITSDKEVRSREPSALIGGISSGGGGWGAGVGWRP